MILDIKTLTTEITDNIRDIVKNLATKPGLTIIMVGDNSASEVYVRNKLKTCETVGIHGKLIHLSADVTSDTLRETIHGLNKDPEVNGILVQSPLPDHIDAQEIFDCIDPLKDVDGFSSANMARLYAGDETGLVPGTPKGIMGILFHYFERTKNKEQRIKNGLLSDSDEENSSLHTSIFNLKSRALEGKTAVVIGKSTIVGKPVSMLLLHAGATVTICHSRTADLGSHTRDADIVISAVGRKNLVTKDMVKPGALVVDVGINVEETTEGRKLFGDCHTEAIGEIADVTPVPGGVGPMTIAMLLTNVLLAHKLQGKQ